MEVGDTDVSWLSHTSTNTTFFPKPLTTLLTCFRGERQKYTRTKVLSQQSIELQPPGSKKREGGILF